MRLNGFGKYTDVDELWPNKNACSAFASSFTTTGNAAWRSVPQLECGKARITTRLCPSPSGQVTSSCMGTVSLPTSLVASTGPLTSVLNSYPIHGVRQMLAPSSHIAYRSKVQVSRLPGTVAYILYVTPAHASETDTTYIHLPINMESSRDTNTTYIHMYTSPQKYMIFGGRCHIHTHAHIYT